MKNLIYTSSIVGGFCAFHLGGLDKLLTFLLFCIVVDYVTGLMKAIKLRNLNSSIGMNGIFKKTGILLAVAMAHYTDAMFIYGEPVFRPSLILVFIGNEAVSIFENLEALDVYIPEQIKQFFAKMRKKDN